MTTMETLAFTILICLAAFLVIGWILIIYDVINEADDYENEDWDDSDYWMKK